MYVHSSVYTLNFLQTFYKILNSYQIKSNYNLDWLGCVRFLLDNVNFCPCRNEGSLVSALKTLLFFTILMVTLPIGLYFATKAYIFEGSMKMSSSDSYFYAAIVAVLAVHVVLALFVYVAWNEGTPKSKGKHD
uniref:Uncharacterized protein n=1 Tax=Poecilia mexicana TaxID=48701 RepID=A0A3B3WED9_9TELE